MRTFLCPTCRELVSEGHLDFPRCTYCGETVTRCGACRHFPGDGLPCLKAKGNPVVRRTSVLDCSSFSPRWLVGRRHPLLSPRGRWQAVGTISLTFSVLLIALLPRPTPSVRLLSARIPSSVAVGSGVPVEIVVESVTGQPVGIRLDRRLFAEFQPLGVEPIPYQVVPFGDALDFWFRPSRSPFSITFRFRSLKEGVFRLRASLLSPDGVLSDWRGALQVTRSKERESELRRLGLLAFLHGR